MAALGALLLVCAAQASLEPYLEAWHGTKCGLEKDGALTCHCRIAYRTLRECQKAK